MKLILEAALPPSRSSRRRPTAIKREKDVKGYSAEQVKTLFASMKGALPERLQDKVAEPVAYGVGMPIRCSLRHSCCKARWRACSFLAGNVSISARSPSAARAQMQQHFPAYACAGCPQT